VSLKKGEKTMAFGLLKKQKAPEPQRAEPDVRRFEYYSPTGDTVVSQREGDVQKVYSTLSEQNQSLLNLSQAESERLLRSLGTPDAARQRELQTQSDQLYSQLSDTINKSSDATFDKVRSQNAERFGGAYNSTFGTQALAEVEGLRQANLADARNSANSFISEQAAADEEAKLLRLNTFRSLAGSVVDGGLSSVGLQGSQLIQSSQALAQNRMEALANLSSNRKSLASSRLQGLSNTLTKVLPTLIMPR
jgi:hypothetical protein